jgi:hypothetical protein
MIAKLRELVDELEKLPDHLQGEAADRLEPIVDQLIEQRWDELFADPRSAAYFEQMSHQIDEAIAKGEILPAPPCEGRE